MSHFAEQRARMWLVSQLREEFYSVRLGAVYGLSQHLDRPEAITALRAAEADDEDERVRQAARDVLAGAMT